MTIAKWKKLQKEKLQKQKIKIHNKISNNFIDNTIKKNNSSAIKTIYYIASIVEKIEDLKKSRNEDMLKIVIDTQQMLKYTELSLLEIKRNLKAMQETSITFINELEDWEEGINLLPYYKIIYGKGKIEIEIYKKIANLIIEVKRNYTMINTKQLMKLKSKHSLRLLPFLQKLANYSENVGKRAKMELDELNEFFGTNYKRLTEIERKILFPVKEELDNNSTLSFIYEVEFLQLERGRPKAHKIVIDVVERNSYQTKMF